MKKLLAFLLIVTVIATSQCVDSLEIDISEPYGTIGLTGFIALGIGLLTISYKESKKENDTLWYKK